MSGPVGIDVDRRRRLLVTRHLLGDAGRADRMVVDVADALALLHSTDPATPYLSIHARSDAAVADVDAAFYDEPRALLRHTTIRRTVFAMPSDVAPLAHGAFNGPLVDRLRRQLVAWIDASDDADDDGETVLARAGAAVVDHVTRHGPATGAQLAGAIDDLRIRFDPRPGAAYSRPGRITSKVLEVLAAEGRIARGRPTGADFTSAAWTWTAMDQWWPAGLTPPDGPSDTTGDAALTGLIDRYLATFGPATVTDMAWWSGLTKTAIRRALDRNAARDVDVGGPESGWVRHDDDLEAPRTEGVVAILPGLDATVMGWKQREWYVADTPGVGIFDRNGNAGPTVWLDGRVIGVWTQLPDGEVQAEVPHDVGRDVRTTVDEELDRTRRWLGDVRVKWRYPTPITKRLVAGI